MFLICFSIGAGGFFSDGGTQIGHVIMSVSGDQFRLVDSLLDNVTGIVGSAFSVIESTFDAGCCLFEANSLRRVLLSFVGFVL